MKLASRRTATHHVQRRLDQSKVSLDRLLDVKEAAAMLGIRPSTLYQWAYQRRIPVVKLFNRALRFRLSTIQKLIEEFERPALQPLSDRFQR